MGEQESDMGVPSHSGLMRHPSSLVGATRSMDTELCVRSLRELARRTLRSRGVIFTLPKFVIRDEDLELQLSDLSPSLYFGIEFKDHEYNYIVITNIGESGGIIGPKTPSASEVWVPLEPQEGFDNLIKEITSLASAGYPACEGCGGRDAQHPWDELAMRESFT